MPYYNRYEKLKVTYDCGEECGIKEPINDEFVRGDYIDSGLYTTIEECMGFDVEYRWVDVEFNDEINTTYICSGTTLYSVEKLQYSTDAGMSWHDVEPLQTRADEVLEYDATLCGGQGGYQERWVEIPYDSGDSSTYVCDGIDLYHREKLQYKTNKITEWTDSDPLQTRKGNLILENAKLCGGDYCEREFRWQVLSFDKDDPTTYYCDENHNLYNIEEYQYSDDCQRTWHPVDPRQTRPYGDEPLYEDWYLCGGTQYPEIKRWNPIEYNPEDESTFTCWSNYRDVNDVRRGENYNFREEDFIEKASGSSIPLLFSKYGLYEYQSSTDSGKTWTTIEPRQILPDLSRVIESASTYCGYSEDLIILAFGNDTNTMYPNINNAIVELNGTKELILDGTTDIDDFHFCYGKYSGGTITSLNNAFRGFVQMLSIVQIPSLKNTLDFHECFYGCRFYRGYTFDYDGVLFDSRNYDDFGNENSTDFGGMFADTNDAINENAQFTINTQSAVDLSELFSDAHSTRLEYLHLSDLNVSNCVDFRGIFKGMSAKVYESPVVLDLSSWNTSKALYMDSMFEGISIGYNFQLIQNFTTNLVTNVSRMFAEVTSIGEIDLSNFSLDSCLNAYEMFYNCNILTTIKMPKNVPKLITMYNMFYNCKKLVDIDFTDFNPISITNVSSLFEKCSSLQTIDIGHWTVPNVEDVRLMYSDCSALTEIDMSNFETTNLKYMDNMCTRCTNLTSIKLNKWSVDNIISYANAFGGCTKLTSITCSSTLRDWIESHKTELGLQNNTISYTIV